MYQSHMPANREPRESGVMRIRPPLHVCVPLYPTHSSNSHQASEKGKVESSIQATWQHSSESIIPSKTPRAECVSSRVSLGLQPRELRFAACVSRKSVQHRRNLSAEADPDTPSSAKRPHPEGRHASGSLPNNPTGLPEPLEAVVVSSIMCVGVRC